MCMKSYKLFFSWQSDRLEKKKTIKKAIIKYANEWKDYQVAQFKSNRAYMAVTSDNAEKKVSTFYLHTLPEGIDVSIKWKMTSKSFSKKVDITVSVCPQFMDIVNEDCPEKTIIVKDYIVDK